MMDALGMTTDNLATEKFLVTGSEGCIGAWVVRNLTLAGCRTVAADITPAGTRLDKILDRSRYSTLVHEHADLLDDQAIERIIKQHGVTRVIHLAALQVPFVYANPLLGTQVNVIGTLRVLEAIRSAGGQVRGVSYASSAAAVGPVNDPHSPETLYGALKLCNEHTARIYARDYGVSSVGLRPCIVYGPTRDQGMTSALTTALKAVALKVPYQIPFNGLVDLQFAEDVASAFIRSALLDGNTEGKVYDLHGDAVTVEDFVASIEKIEPAAKGLVSYLDDTIPGNVDVDDIELRNRIGDLPKTPIEDGIRKSLSIFGRHIEQGLLAPNEVLASTTK